MASVNVKLPDGLEEEMNEYMTEAGVHMNSSELVRDALREYLEEHKLQLSDYAHKKIRKAEQDVKAGRVQSLEDIEEKYNIE